MKEGKILIFIGAIQGEVFPYKNKQNRSVKDKTVCEKLFQYFLFADQALAALFNGIAPGSFSDNI